MSSELPPAPGDYLAKAVEALRRSDDVRAQTYASIALASEVRALREVLSEVVVTPKV